MSENLPNSVLSLTYNELTITIMIGKIAIETYFTSRPYALTQNINENRMRPARIDRSLENLYRSFIVIVKNSCIMVAIRNMTNAANRNLFIRRPASITAMKPVPEIVLNIVCENHLFLQKQCSHLKEAFLIVSQNLQSPVVYH